MAPVCALLILRLPTKASIAKVEPILTHISSKFINKLYIKIHTNVPNNVQLQRNNMRKILPEIYKTANNVDPTMDVSILNPINPKHKYSLVQPPSIIMTNLTRNDDEGGKPMIREYLKSSFLDCFENIPIEILENFDYKPDEASNQTLECSSPSQYDSVALGGTFDCIHVGHKILIGEASLQCRKTLTVGVTCENMIKSKILWELIEPVEQRMDKVRSYLHEIDPDVEPNVVPISDIYGPTITDEDIECLVVSVETIKGSNKINEARTVKGWNPLKVSIIELMKDTDSSSKSIMERLNENKVSSSVARLKKLGTILREPEINKNLPSRPYLIGLTGGIASGKTAIGKYLESLGCGYINYDMMGHQTYADINGVVYKEIVDIFGDSILDGETKLIDRAKLGKIVFSDKSKREKLESIVWPAIYKLVDEKIDALKVDHEIIVLESALLIESKQHNRVHQVWTTFIQPEEAIERQMKSRGLTREDAEKRVNAQLDNLSRIRYSNAVFCSAWEQEFTQYQVKKCLTELRNIYLTNLQ